MSSLSLLRLLGRNVLQQRRPTVTCCNVILSRAPTTHVRYKFTLTSLSGNFQMPRALPKSTFRTPHSNHFNILQFTQSTPWSATHLDRQIPRRSANKPPARSRIDNLPPPIIFWSILAANVGVFIAWYYAENNYVCGYYICL